MTRKRLQPADEEKWYMYLLYLCIILIQLVLIWWLLWWTYAT